MTPAKINHLLLAIISASIAYLTISANLRAMDTALLQTDPQDPEAQFQLARSLLNGEGVQKNTSRALELMTLAANQGHAEAMGGLGYFYASGLEVTKDQKIAIEWFQKGAEAGGPKSQLNYGKMLLEAENPSKIDEGLKWLQAAVDRKQPDAAHILGTIYLLGQYGQPINYQKAIDCLIISAEAGNEDSQNAVGFIYSQPYLGQQNEKEAQKWFRKAASVGNLKAQSNLGTLLWSKSTSDRHVRIEALSWLLSASLQGDETAVKFLRDNFISIDPTDLEEARKLAPHYQKGHIRHLSSEK